tara:strand:+ start:369 stop:1010 length:642 start_codon:yes stop_codon:yes gene_type:complete
MNGSPDKQYILNLIRWWTMRDISSREESYVLFEMDEVTNFLRITENIIPPMTYRRDMNEIINDYISSIRPLLEKRWEMITGRAWANAPAALQREEETFFSPITSYFTTTDNRPFIRLMVQEFERVGVNGLSTAIEMQYVSRGDKFREIDRMRKEMERQEEQAKQSKRYEGNPQPFQHQGRSKDEVNERERRIREMRRIAREVSRTGFTKQLRF